MTRANGRSSRERVFVHMHGAPVPMVLLHLRDSDFYMDVVCTHAAFFMWNPCIGRDSNANAASGSRLRSFVCGRWRRCRMAHTSRSRCRPREGIPGRPVPHLFGKRAGLKGGTGLGRAICGGSLEVQGGWVRVECGGPGLGARSVCRRGRRPPGEGTETAKQPVAPMFDRLRNIPQYGRRAPVGIDRRLSSMECPVR